jgi:microcompartment protein CcmK/EutM
MFSSFALALLPLASPAAQLVGGNWETRFHLEGDAPYKQLGYSGACIGDIDADGVNDWVLVAKGSTTHHFSAPAIYAISGATGTTLHQLAPPGGKGGKEPAIALSFTGVGDADQDGFGDYLIGQVNQSTRPSVYFISGRTGTPTGRIDAKSAGSWFGAKLASIQDLDGDNVREWVISAEREDANGLWKSGTLFIYSGRTRQQLARIDGPQTRLSLGSNLQVAGDLTGDGFDELVVTHRAVGGNGSGSQVSIYSTRTLSHLLTLQAPDPADTLGSSLGMAGDMTGDGIPEILVRARSSTLRERIAVYSGANGDLVRTVRNLSSSVAFGEQCGGTGDLDGDGIDDFFASDKFAANYRGSVSFYSGADGSLLLERLGGLHSWFGSLVVASGQPHMNGGQELLIGAPYRNGAQGPRYGEAFVVRFDRLLRASTNKLSVAQGGTIEFELDFPSLAAGNEYLLLASALGTGPILKNVAIPLSSDVLLYRTQHGTVPGAQHDPLRGSLDAQARAQVQIQVPAGTWANQVGLTVYFAAVARPVGKPPQWSSVSVPITLTP